MFAIAAGYATSAFAQDSKPPLVKTRNGIVQGVSEASGIRSFKGIPFAQPPVGNLRWKEPQAPLNWPGIKLTDHFGHQAMQRALYSDMIFRSDGNSEDCLYLNVWTPAHNPKAHLPVLVYFYGGGFNAGDGSECRYDGEAMAKRGIVTITVNYRLGIFGFFVHPELVKESPHQAAGNYGLMDQHAALVWVQKNIAAFGGDPNRVTIAGESAGSMSVSGQVASPLSKGLFIRAIAESGSLLGTSTPMPREAAEQNGVKFATAIGASSLADLRNLPADKLLELSAKGRFPITIDGYFLPETPDVIFSKGNQMHVALLAGWNTAENDYHSVLGKNEPTVENYKSAIERSYGDHAGDILKAYPATNNDEVKIAATNLAADRFIAFATWKFIDMQNATSGMPVYRYLFARSRPAFADGKPNPTMGAVHSAEIEYALGNLPLNKVYGWTADDYKVSETTQQYFANFIKTGSPNGDSLPQWPLLKPNGRQVMVIDVDSHLQTADVQSRYQLLDSFLKR